MLGGADRNGLNGLRERRSINSAGPKRHVIEPWHFPCKLDRCWEFQSGPCVDTGECRMSPDHFAGSWSGSGQTRLLTSLEIGQGADGNMSKFHMHIEPLEKRASEKEPVARLAPNEDGSNNQQLAELLRRRIEELDRRLAILNSENEKSLALWESRPTGVVVWTTPTFWRR